MRSFRFDKMTEDQLWRWLDRFPVQLIEDMQLQRLDPVQRNTRVLQYYACLEELRLRGRQLSLLTD